MRLKTTGRSAVPQQSSWGRDTTSADLASLRNRAVLPREKIKCDKLHLVPQLPPGLFSSLGLRGKAGSLCCVEPAQPLPEESALQGYRLAAGPPFSCTAAGTGPRQRKRFSYGSAFNTC